MPQGAIRVVQSSNTREAGASGWVRCCADKNLPTGLLAGGFGRGEVDTEAYTIGILPRDSQPVPI
jgi:hypothetical protein